MTSEFAETQKLLNMLKESHLSILYPVVVISVSELMEIFLSKHMLPLLEFSFLFNTIPSNGGNPFKPHRRNSSLWILELTLLL